MDLIHTVNQKNGSSTIRVPVYSFPPAVLICSSNGQLLLCGMHSGFIRVYPLQPGDTGLTSMQAYWALSVHDNQYGHLRHIRCSYDDHFVLTAGEDGNIFSFSLLPPEELEKGLQRKRARVPSPRVRPRFMIGLRIGALWINKVSVSCIYILFQQVGLENESLAQDIEDPAAYRYSGWGSIFFVILF